MKRIPWQATLILVLIWLSGSVLAGVSASVDRQEIYDGDTLTLTLETDGGVQGQPDLAPCERTSRY